MQTQDITTIFRDAAHSLLPGTLIKDDFFSLFESVGALEIGDPTMDSGCFQARDEDAMAFDISKPLRPEQLIWIMDQLMSRQVSWLKGYPISQTLFTSLHIDALLWPDPAELALCQFDSSLGTIRPDITENLLRAFCILVIKTSDLFHSLVTSQHFYEEEDFSSFLFNRDLLHKFTSAEILEHVPTLDSLMSDIDRYPRISKEMRNALLARYCFYHYLIGIFELHLENLRSLTSDRTYDSTQIIAILADIVRSKHLGEPVPAAFSTQLQKKLASTMPPRPMISATMEQVEEYWISWIKHAQNVFSITCSASSLDTLQAYQLIGHQRPRPDVYSRALMQTFLSTEGKVLGRWPPRYFVEQDLRSLTMPASTLIQTTSPELGLYCEGKLDVMQSIEIFFSKSESTFIQIFTRYSLNECRTRRTLCHAIVEWDNLQVEAEEVDALIHKQYYQDASTQYIDAPYQLSSWVYHQKLDMIRMIIQLGFEQSIYAPYELAGMYWYLMHICDTHLAHLDRTSRYITARQERLSSMLKSSGISAGTYEEANQECEEAINRLFTCYAHLQATRRLARSLQLIYVILGRFGHCHLPEHTYSNDTMRYEIRMKPFLFLNVPECPSAEEMQTQSELNEKSTQELLHIINESVGNEAPAWELPEIRTTVIDGNLTVDGLKKVQILEDKWRAYTDSFSQTSSLIKGLTAKLSQAQTGTRIARFELPEVGTDSRPHPYWIVPVVELEKSNGRY